MNAASAVAVHELRPRILDRRARLTAAAGSLSIDYLNDLLAEIDAALQKIDNGTHGLCDTCGDPIEADRMERDPLARFCVDHLSHDQRKAHEQDLALAMEIQARLLPARDLATPDWETHYRYEPAGAVGGDYCELIVSGDGKSLFFAVGDVAGKGVAASLLMTHLSAIFRSLLSVGLPLGEVISRANRLFCDSTASAHYATLVAGRTTADGVELCNAGHCSPLILRPDGTEWLQSTGLPLGLFCTVPYSVSTVRLKARDSLVLYSDGITEAESSDGHPFEDVRLVGSLRTYESRGARAMADGVLQDVVRFADALRPQDDRTLLIVRRQQ